MVAVDFTAAGPLQIGKVRELQCLCVVERGGKSAGHTFYPGTHTFAGYIQEGVGRDEFDRLHHNPVGNQKPLVSHLRQVRGNGELTVIAHREPVLEEHEAGEPGVIASDAGGTQAHYVSKSLD